MLFCDLSDETGAARRTLDHAIGAAAQRGGIRVDAVFGCIGEPAGDGAVAGRSGIDLIRAAVKRALSAALIGLVLEQSRVRYSPRLIDYVLVR